MKSMNKLVSIIVPVYNSKEYLAETILGLLSQTYSNIEIILVDDGSSDGSSAICDEFSNKYSNVRTIHEENGGICKARNTGLSSAKGVFIFFCDNDDYMDPQCIEVTVNAAITRQCDIVRFRRIRELNKGRITVKATYPKFKEHTEVLDDWDTYLRIINATGYGVWAGLYKKDLLEKYRVIFDESIKYGFEDHVFVSEVLSHAKSVCILPETLYTWKQRSSHSTSMKTSEEILKNRVESIKKWIIIENEIKKRVGATLTQIQLRQYDYAKFIANMVIITNMDLEGQKNLYFSLLSCCDISLYPCSFDNYKLIEKLTNKSLYLGDMGKYKLLKTWYGVLRVCSSKS